MIVRLLKGAFSYRTCYRLPSYYSSVLLMNSKTYMCRYQQTLDGRHFHQWLQKHF